MNKEDLKLKLINKMAQSATYDRELAEWSISFDRACDIVDTVVDNCDLDAGGEKK